MKILAVCGSRRENGNTSAVIKKSLEPFKKEGIDTEIIYPGNLYIAGCSGCEGCSETDLCIVKDDMQEIYRKLQEADALIVGTPTYFYNMTSDIKRFIDDERLLKSLRLFP